VVLYLITTLKKQNLFFTAVIFSALFTSHNIFSLVSIPIIIFYAFIVKEKRAFLAILAGMLLSSYFWIPALGEISQVHATQVATLTKYSDHFLCLLQLWSSPWGYGGSTAGCISDGMSFMVGKAQILFAGLGILIFLYKLFTKKRAKIDVIALAVGVILFGSIFLTTESSVFVWNVFSPILSLFQFPWRFLLFCCKKA